MSASYSLAALSCRPPPQSTRALAHALLPAGVAGLLWGKPLASGLFGPGASLSGRGNLLVKARKGDRILEASLLQIQPPSRPRSASCSDLVSVVFLVCACVGPMGVN